MHFRAQLGIPIELDIFYQSAFVRAVTIKIFNFYGSYDNFEKRLKQSKDLREIWLAAAEATTGKVLSQEVNSAEFVEQPEIFTYVCIALVWPANLNFVVTKIP